MSRRIRILIKVGINSERRKAEVVGIQREEKP